MRKISRAIRSRLGPVGLSLAAAALTAVGFAAVSVAQDDGKSEGNRAQGDRFEMPAPPPGVRMLDRLSDEDREKLESFRKCMEDQGAPAPPRLRQGEGPPGPPSSEDLEKIRKAHEACKDELPEDLQDGPMVFGHGGPCGPPPGAQGQGDRQQGGNEEQDFVVPAPAAPGGASS
jgi:hypothetical protein